MFIRNNCSRNRFEKLHTTSTRSDNTAEKGIYRRRAHKTQAGYPCIRRYLVTVTDPVGPAGDVPELNTTSPVVPVPAAHAPDARYSEPEKPVPAVPPLKRREPLEADTSALDDLHTCPRFVYN